MMRPKVGLALGSGGARGIAHIGVIQVLEEAGIPIDYISGSSMGSLIGACYAAGITPDMMEKLAINLKRKYWLDFTVPKMGFIAGEKVKEMVRLLTQGKDIEQLHKPLAVVATDLRNGERVVFTKGPIAPAVRASISIPGIFIPEEVDGKLLIDGGVIDRVPITAAQAIGAECVIGVDVGIVSEEVHLSSIFDVIAQTIQIMEKEIFRYRIVDADVLIRPIVGGFSATNFTQVEELIEAGKEAAFKSLDQIRKVIESRGIHEE
ncbi:esterase [Ammoniphilus oxalaticus]|uniref:Esterase n=1 Tax=Ammoniphilus oxalaticus TaxID=66863 RepID=A0A419SJF1_9BACL|nr:patatin-like phospholipase family protein [Ammoniphilus oxalaticus]RKD24161.1 esterase [Ammoniphilus oxalaticus]